MSLDKDRLISNAQIHLPGALDSAIEFELFNVLDRFFRESGVWVVETQIVTVVGTTTYAVAPPTGAIPVRLVSVENDNKLSVSATMPDTGTVELAAKPSQVETLTAKIAYTVDAPVPPATLTAYPASTFNQYFAGLLHGVMAQMMAHPAKPYSSTTLATYHMREFNKAIALAKSDAIRANAKRTQAWRFPQSFAVRRH